MGSKSIMKIKRINPETKYLYHFTLKRNVGKILEDKTIKSSDDYVFFTESLSDSVTVFNNEMMAAGKPYIDTDCNLRYREQCNKEDYCILKIPYINDDRFFKFEFSDRIANSIYELSIAHKGKYDFRKAQILEIPDEKKRKKFAKLAAAGLALGIALTPCAVFADSWLDDGNYDISWYSEGANYGNIDNSNLEKKLAGVSYLSNQGKFVEPIEIKVNNTSRKDIDLSAHSWSPISNVNFNWVEGIHRIILKYGDKIFVEGPKEDPVIVQTNAGVAHHTKIKAGKEMRTWILHDNKTVSELFDEDIWDLYNNDAHNAYERRDWITGSMGTDVSEAEHLLLTHNGIEVFGDERVSEFMTSEDDFVEYFDDRKIYSVTVEDPSRKDPTNLRRIVSDPSADIETIREKTSTVVGIPICDLKLKLGDSTLLKDGKTLASYKIDNNTQIFYERGENHKWDAGKVTKPATEKAEGVKTYTCTVCKTTKTETIPKLKSTPLVRITAGKKSLTIGWEKIKGAAGYDIFFAKCNRKDKKGTCKNVKTIKGNKRFSWKKTGLKKGTAYKVYVKAYIYLDGKKQYLDESPLMHAYAGNGNRKYTNAKSVKIKNVKKGKLTLKKGKSFKIKAKVKKVKKNKKLFPKGHVPSLRYMTSDKKIATVSSNGRIKAVAKGKCCIYAYAHNGVSKKVIVTVK